MPDPRLDAPPSIAEPSVLWQGVRAVLAASAAGLVVYVGFTAVELAGLSSEQSATVVADPPLQTPTTPPTTRAPAPTAAPTRPATHAPKPATPTSRSAKPAARPRPAPKPSAPTKASHQVRSKQRAELSLAQRVDRELASLLRGPLQPPAPWMTATPWVEPVAGYHLTARFGDSGGLWAARHTGLDFAAPAGTPVHAVASGTVTFAGRDGSYGNKIEIAHPDGTVTWYAHLSRIDVRVGTPVGTGAVIGAVGATGNTTGPHLHLEVRPGGGDPVDPYTALKEHGVRP